MIDTLQSLPVPTLDILTIEQIQASCARSEPITFGDPTLAHTDLPLRETFYPLGFPLELSTNSEEVLVAAAESWHGFSKQFDTLPIQVHVGVTDVVSSDCPPTPVCRIRRHLCSNIADGENFAISDFAQAFSNIWINRSALAHPSYLRYFFLESSALCQIATRYTTPVHAACVALDGKGFLLCGDSGAGKSTLSYACARAGWTYVTDDGSFLVNGSPDRLAVGNCRLFRFRPSAEALFPELHGRQVIQRAERGKPSIEMSTVPLGLLATSDTTSVHHVVFLNRRNVQRQELVAFPTEVARQFMLQRMYSAPEMLKIQSGMIDTLLELGALELRYTNLAWAIERLTRLVREGR